MVLDWVRKSSRWAYTLYDYQFPYGMIGSVHIKLITLELNKSCLHHEMGTDNNLNKFKLVSVSALDMA